MSRRSSLLTMTLFSILCVAGTMAEQGSGLLPLQEYDSNDLQGQETVIVKEGTDASLLCRSFTQYGGDIRWEATDENILSGSAQTGGYLIIPNVKRNMTVS